MKRGIAILLIMTATGTLAQELRKSIYFGGGSYYVDEEQLTELTHWIDSIPNLLQKYQIQLTSHTDPIGGKEFNEWLSNMRSNAVLKILVDHHVPEEKITVKDWDYENAVYRNDTYGGRALNRRVDVVLHPIVF